MKKRKLFSGSKIFQRIFLSYVLLITIFLLLYAAWFFREYNKRYISLENSAAEQYAARIMNAFDQQMLTAQSLCASVNRADSCKAVYQATMIENKTVTSLQLYDILNTLKGIKASSNNLNVYSLLLYLNGDSRVYSSGQLISVEKTGRLYSQSGLYLGVASACDLLGVKINGNIILNKQFFIYSDQYNAGSLLSPKGRVLVLFDLTSLSNNLQKLFAGQLCGVSVTVNGTEAFRQGESSRYGFTAESSVVSGMQCTVYLTEAAMQVSYREAVIPLLTIFIVSALMMIGTYFMSRHYSRPILSINRLVGKHQEDAPARSDEFESILSGIESLIGERNGIREKMVTIAPYAREGLLHSIINGDESNSHVQMMISEQFWEMKHAYFVVGLLNIASAMAGEAGPQQLTELQDVVKQLCEEQDQQENVIAYCPRDAENLFIVVNSDNKNGLEEYMLQLFRLIEREVDDKRYMLTMGVSRLETDISSLKSACMQAQQALEQMLTGNRGAVYFQPEQTERGVERYEFPKDAQKRITKALSESDYALFDALLTELYNKNVKEAELPARELRLMLDELFLCMRNVVKAAFDLNTIHVQIEKMKEPFTIDEAFSYFRDVFRAVLDHADQLKTERQSTSIEQEIVAYIDANALNPQLSLTLLSEQFGVSTKMIGLICKNAYGTTFLQHVHEKQIQHAVMLLKTTDLSMEEIARQCGYLSLLTFRRNFKAMMNQNPSDLRK